MLKTLNNTKARRKVESSPASDWKLVSIYDQLASLKAFKSRTKRELLNFIQLFVVGDLSQRKARGFSGLAIQLDN
jgi:hypothetical protein